MTPQSDPILVSRYKAYSRLAGILTFAVGCFTLIGWTLNIPDLKSILSGITSIKINTALAFVLAGIALVMLHRSTTPRTLVIIQVSAVTIALLGLLTLFEYVFGWDLGIDQWLIPDSTATIFPGRMLPFSALNFLLLGCALLVLVRSYNGNIAQVLALIAGFLDLLALMGYLYGVKLFYQMGIHTSIALLTIITFFILNTGILLAQSEHGLAAILTSRSAGGVLVRRLLPATIILPVAFGWLRLQGQLAGLYDTQFGVAIFALSNVVAGCLLIGWIAFRLRRIDEGREEAVENLRRLRDELEMRVQERTAALVIANRQLEAEISERKRAAAHFSALLESAPDAMVIASQSGQIVLVNSQTQRVFGYRRDELIGKPVEMLIPETLRSRHPEHRAQYMRTPRVREMGVGLELLALRKDGSQFPVEISLSPIETDEGILVASAIRDITDRKETEEALRERNEIFRQLAGHINQAIWLRNAADDAMIYMSPAYQTITGRTVESVLESPGALLEIIHPEDMDRVKQARRFHPKESFEIEYRIVRPDGLIRWIRARNFPIFDASGIAYRIAGVSEDITIRKEAEARQLELQVERERVELLKRFITGASHDFSTPLTIMSTGLYLLGKAKDAETQQRELDKITEQVQRIQRLVENLFTLSRLDVSSAAEFKFERCDLNTLVRAVCEEQTPLVEHRRDQLILKLADQLPPIFADAEEISLAIHHILANAINYSPDSGNITVSTRQQDASSVLLTIQDNGIGISDSDLPHIFERFYRADPARNINNGGLGLGLSIAQRIVDAHHGSINVQSVPGKGSTFSIVLPTYSASAITQTSASV